MIAELAQLDPVVIVHVSHLPVLDNARAAYLALFIHETLRLLVSAEGHDVDDEVCYDDDDTNND